MSLITSLENDILLEDIIIKTVKELKYLASIIHLIKTLQTSVKKCTKSERIPPTKKNL